MNEKGHQDKGGKSSFARTDIDRLFEIMNLKPGMTFLDLGCGRGEFSLYAADIVGDKGKVYAVDKWEQGIAILKEEAEKTGKGNIEAIVGDISNQLPIEENSIDVCLVASVFHGIVKNEILESTVREIKRVLRSGGLLVITEWKEAGPPGPPTGVWISETEIKKLLLEKGFRFGDLTDIGQYLYAITFVI